MKHHVRYLFGGDKPWDPCQWVTTDDRVRGGSSQSYLTASSASKARFYGTLDTSTLGGAGFASQHSASGLEWDLSAYEGIVIDVAASSDHKRYALTLKDNVPTRREDGREKSSVTWEADFKPHGPGRIFLAWDDFKATYRGREQPDEKPLDLAKIKRVGLMMRSFFDEQHGDFSLELHSIAAQPARADDASAAFTEESDADIRAQKEAQPTKRHSRWRGLFCGML